MINLKSAVYSALSSDSAITAAVGSNIRFFADDAQETDAFDDRLPQVTYARLYSRPSPQTGVRNETYQVSSWAKDPVSAENLSAHVVELFNRTKNATWRNATVQYVNDTYDAESKAF